MPCSGIRSRPVFVDIEPAHYTLDPALLEAAITPVRSRPGPVRSGAWYGVERHAYADDSANIPGTNLNKNLDAARERAATDQILRTSYF
jgi:hypothetical protein